MNKIMIQEIRQRIMKEVNSLGYDIDENNVVYDSKSYSKYNKIIFVISKIEVPPFVFEYNPEQNSINLT